MSLMFPALAGVFFTLAPPGKPNTSPYTVLNGYEGKQATISTCRLIMGLVLPANCY